MPYKRRQQPAPTVLRYPINESGQYAGRTDSARLGFLRDGICEVFKQSYIVLAELLSVQVSAKTLENAPNIA